MTTWQGIVETADQHYDPDFDPEVPTFYYLRVLEIPTPRWNLYDSVAIGVKLPEGVPKTLQERALTSPIWYLPESGRPR